jgi:hypothetical protein
MSLRDEEDDTHRFDLFFAYKDKKISIHQFRARMKDLGYTDDDVDMYLDGE